MDACGGSTAAPGEARYMENLESPYSFFRTTQDE